VGRGRDFVPFYARTGAQWTRVNYAKTAGGVDETIGAPQEIGLVEIGPNWYVDDLPPMLFMKAAPNSHGFVLAARY
jgi:hypothetical protein